MVGFIIVLAFGAAVEYTATGTTCSQSVDLDTLLTVAFDFLRQLGPKELEVIEVNEDDRTVLDEVIKIKLSFFLLKQIPGQYVFLILPYVVDNLLLYVHKLKKILKFPQGNFTRQPMGVVLDLDILDQKLFKILKVPQHWHLHLLNANVIVYFFIDLVVCCLCYGGDVFGREETKVEFMELYVEEWFALRHPHWSLDDVAVIFLMKEVEECRIHDDVVLILLQIAVSHNVQEIVFW